jgi:cholest-4-en-3-one 26-monooxygenase
MGWDVIDDIDLLDLDRWAREGAPYDWFARLRDEAPVWKHPNQGAGFWVVSGYDDVVALGRCPHVLSSDGQNGGVSGLGPGDEMDEGTQQMGAQAGIGGNPFVDDVAMLLTLDPPEHTAYRKVVNKGFTPRMIGALEEKIRSLVAGYLDATARGAPFDLVTEVAMPLPMQVIAEMIGAPRSMHADLARWSNEIIAATDPEYRTDDEFSQIRALLSLFQAFDEVREAHDGVEIVEDLTSVLLSAEVDGESLSEIRFKMFLFLLALAGNETTRNAISHGVMRLAQNPEQWQRLRDDPSLVPTAVEEIIRYASPVLYFRRNAIAPMEVGGQSIEPGDLVSLWYVSANRDASVFGPTADEFDVGRDPNPHIAFGGGGPHFCLGASLARLEVRLVLEALLERYESIEQVGAEERLRSNFLHGIKHLPVRLVAAP